MSLDAFAGTVKTARGTVEIPNGSVARNITQWEGTINDLHDVTFVQANFSRKQAHTEVFVGCSNLKFISSNLNNVELQADFTTFGSLTIHQKTEVILGQKIHTIERGDGQTETWLIEDETIDLIEQEYGLLRQPEKQKVADKWQADGKDITTVREKRTLQSKTPTTPDKLIKGTKISSNDTRFDTLIRP